MAYFNRPATAQSRLLTRRLTKLYSDTKQSYESARVVPGPDPLAPVEDPDVLSLRREFQVQQDRLLAWGMFWADVGVQSASGDVKGKKGSLAAGSGEELEIDRKIDQAGLGDLVASVMEEIKRLLDESGRLQHPERYELGKTKAMGGKAFVGGGAAPSPKLERKDLKLHHLETGRALLDRLVGCIDVLYSLVDGQEGQLQQQQGPRPPDQDDGHAAPPTSLATKLETATELRMADVYSHPLYIDFARLQPMHDPNAEADNPPSYDDVQDTSGTQTRSIYLYSEKQSYVIVDLVGTRSIPAELYKESPLQQLHAVADKLAGGGLLSWDGHLRLLGFTLAGAKQSLSTRFGLIYALPAPSDPTALQQYQSLTTVLASSYEQDASIPPLENKLRLAYNIALLATGYLAHNTTHGYIRSNNIIFLQETDNRRRLGKALRSPYMLQPIQKIVGLSSIDEGLNNTIYHHPDADESGYGTVAAHDVYSVGLLLLEIGLWMPLKKFFKPKYNNEKSLFRDRLRKAYSPKLASKCGTRYMKAVQKCLDAPEELADKTNTIDSAEYLLSIVKDLAHCCAIDEVEQPSNLDIEVFEAMIEEQRRTLPSPGSEQKQKKSITSIPIEGNEATEDIPVGQAARGARPQAGRRRATQRGADASPMRKFPEIPIPQEKLTIWNTLLMPKLQKILTDALRDSKESASCSLMMIGSSPDRASTTIVVQCADTRKVHDELHRRFRCKRGWGLVVCKGEVRRSGRHPRRSIAKHARRSKLDPNDLAKQASRPIKQRQYQKRPSHGASIGAFKDNTHLPPVSFGGTVLVDGIPYGMSVHHMLDDASDREDETSSDDSDDELEPDLELTAARPERSSARRQHGLETMGLPMESDGIMSMEHLTISDEDIDMDDDRSETSTIRPDYSAFDEDGNEFWFLDDSSEPDLDSDHSSLSDDDETASVGDRAGYMPYELDDDELYITQPALDDVDEDFFPSIEDRDDDHLESHKFGLVHASSGIRRIVKDGTKHEIDWALIKVNTDRCTFAKQQQQQQRRQRDPNKNQSRDRSSSYVKRKPLPPVPSQQPTLASIAPLITLPNLPVRSCGRTSGVSQGRISPAMSLIKFHGRTSFSSSLTVDGGFGVPGDSGAWIWSHDNELCGHVLAWADGAKVAFMAPMEVIADDIKRSLGATDVRLPAQTEQQPVSSASSQISNAAIQADNKGNTPPIPAPVSVMTHDSGIGLDFEQGSGVEPGKESHHQRQQQQRHSRSRELEIALERMSREAQGQTLDDDGPEATTTAAALAPAVAERSDPGREGERPCSSHQERFDMHMTGGQELKAIPMARALS